MSIGSHVFPWNKQWADLWVSCSNLKKYLSNTKDAHDIRNKFINDSQVGAKRDFKIIPRPTIANTF